MKTGEILDLPTLQFELYWLYEDSGDLYRRGVPVELLRDFTCHLEGEDPPGTDHSGHPHQHSTEKIMASVVTWIFKGLVMVDQTRAPEEFPGFPLTIGCTQAYEPGSLTKTSLPEKAMASFLICLIPLSNSSVSYFFASIWARADFSAVSTVSFPSLSTDLNSIT
jgi:hypothetical protein